MYTIWDQVNPPQVLTLGVRLHEFAAFLLWLVWGTRGRRQTFLKPLRSGTSAGTCGFVLPEPEGSSRNLE